jgi:hypothetical protein
VDFHLPSQFDLSYIGEDSEKHRPVILHRGVIGATERMMAYLIELYAGAFPAWLAPVQAMVIPIADRHADYAHDVLSQLRAAGFRAEVDARSERMNNKIRAAQLQKIPYMLVVGDRGGGAGDRTRAPANQVDAVFQFIDRLNDGSQQPWNRKKQALIWVDRRWMREVGDAVMASPTGFSVTASLRCRHDGDGNCGCWRRSLVFAINLVPAFMPSSWMVLAFFYIRSSICRSSY